MGKNQCESDRLLTVEQLSYQIGDKTILRDLNFAFPRGSFNVLIGANGAGKSTLLRLLSGYLRTNSGKITLNQRNLMAFSPAELARHRAVMQQQSQINFPFSGQEIIEMGCLQQKVDRAALAEVVALTECQSLLHKPYRQLSGGEQQRIQLARALLQLWSVRMDQQLLLLDEPTSALDLHYQQHCLRLLRTLCETRGLTVCAILHDLNLTALYADQVILLADQQIQAQGSPHEVICAETIRRCYRADVQVVPHFAQDTPQVMLCR